MSEDLEREWTLDELLAVVREADLEELSVSLPGRVDAYDAAAQTADVTPLVRRVISRDDGRVVTAALPTVRAVPVCWPRAGAWFMHMPLAAGDTVLLVCCDRDPALWRSTGELSDPLDRRLHHLAHAVAIPGIYPRTRELGDTPADALVLGQDGGPTIRIGATEIKVGTAAAQFAALANLVSNELTKIQTTLASATAAGGGAPVVYGTPYVPGSVAASKVKVE